MERVITEHDVISKLRKEFRMLERQVDAWQTDLQKTDGLSVCLMR